jgi:hypothetical protein
MTLLHLHDGDSADFAGAGGEPGVVFMPDLAWRVAKLRLEEQNQQRFLKAMPRFLPYTECRKWVQAFSRWKTKEDWREWIAMGEKRNSYIPVCTIFVVVASPSFSKLMITLSFRASRTNTMADLVSGSVGITFFWKTLFLTSTIMVGTGNTNAILKDINKYNLV